MTDHSTATDGGANTAPDIDLLEALAGRREILDGKIERAFWCLNLLLLDGFDREELDAIRAEVADFTRDCCDVAWRRK